MSKRFIDTTMHRESWYKSLSPKLKAAWHHIYQDCDPAGVWHIDLFILSHFVGDEITMDDLKNLPVRFLPENKLLLENMISMNQIKKLSIKNNAHKQIIESLKKHNLIEWAKGGSLWGPPSAPQEGPSNVMLGNVMLGKGNVKREDLTWLYEQFPRPGKLEESLDIMHNLLKDDKDLELMQQLDSAINTYAYYVRKNKTEDKYILSMPKFLEDWRAWLKPDLVEEALNDPSRL